MVGSSLIALGLVWWQAIIAIICSSLISTIFIVLNSTPGAFYHLGFPVANRYTWGMYGMQFVVLNRILLSLVWYAVQAWIGGSCVYVCLEAIWPNLEERIPNHMPASTGMTTAQFMTYIVFSVISLPIIYIRPHKLTKFFYVSASTVLVFEFSLLIWALATMGSAGFGDTITGTPDVQDLSKGWAVIYGIISCIGGISAGKHTKSQVTLPRISDTSCRHFEPERLRSFRSAASRCDSWTADLSNNLRQYNTNYRYLSDSCNARALW
jgi:nucleobase:cation symporter-1, NCS1 family